MPALGEAAPQGTRCRKAAHASDWKWTIRKRGPGGWGRHTAPSPQTAYTDHEAAHRKSRQGASSASEAPTGRNHRAHRNRAPGVAAGTGYSDNDSQMALWLRRPDQTGHYGVCSRVRPDIARSSRFHRGPASLTPLLSTIRAGAVVREAALSRNGDPKPAGAPGVPGDAAGGPDPSPSQPPFLR